MSLQLSHTFVWNIVDAEYPVLVHVSVTLSPSSTQGTVSIDRAYALGSVNAYSSS